MSNTNTGKTNILRITESSLMLAFAVVLSLVKLFEMPMGGTITAFSMLPIAIIAYRYGTKWGLLTGAAYGLLQMFLGMKNLQYGATFLAVVCIILFDYIVAFMVLGFSGIFRGKIKNDEGIEMGLGILFSCILRYACHFITGWVIWGVWAPEGQPAWLYSLGYNASYMVPETAITVIAAILICTFLDFRNRDITKRGAANDESAPIKPFLLRLTGIIIGIFGIIYDISVYVYSLSNAEYTMPSPVIMLAVFAGCIIVGGIFIFISHKSIKKAK